jgi:hypothetical protein
VRDGGQLCGILILWNELREDLRGDDALLAENADLSVAWSRFDNGAAMMYCMDLIQFFQMKTMDEMVLKSKIPMVFYFLSIVLLLSTFFFLFRSRL